MSVELDEIETTRGEKLLAAILVVFLLIGAVWAYSKLDRHRAYTPAAVSAADQTAIDRYEQAQSALGRAGAEAGQARSDLELRREAYRTALDAKQPADVLEREYRAAEARFATAQRVAADAQAELAAAQPAGRAAYTRRDHASRDRDRSDARTTFLLRLAYCLLFLGGAYWAFGRLRRSRYFPVGSALVTTAALLALVFAGDYLGDYIRWQDLGPLVLSLVGIAFTLAAFVALQRYLAARLPVRRVRRGECPFCGFPVRGGSHCEGCGRQVVAPCPACAAPRRVGVAHCAACGAA